MKTIIGSDKSGFSLKEAVKAHLLEQGHEVEDGGTPDLDHVKPYFVTAVAVAPALVRGCPAPVEMVGVQDEFGEVGQVPYLPGASA